MRTSPWQHYMPLVQNHIRKISLSARIRGRLEYIQVFTIMNDTQTLGWESIDSIILKWAGTLWSFIHPNVEIDYGSEPFRTVWVWSKGGAKLPEPMNIGLVWFGYFCGLVLVWTSSKLNCGNTMWCATLIILNSVWFSALLSLQCNQMETKGQLRQWD